VENYLSIDAFYISRLGVNSMVEHQGIFTWRTLITNQERGSVTYLVENGSYGEYIVNFYYTAKTY